jgi:hypothetical protein
VLVCMSALLLLTSASSHTHSSPSSSPSSFPFPLPRPPQLTPSESGEVAGSFLLYTTGSHRLIQNWDLPPAPAPASGAWKAPEAETLRSAEWRSGNAAVAHQTSSLSFFPSVPHLSALPPGLAAYYPDQVKMVCLAQVRERACTRVRMCV